MMGDSIKLENRVVVVTGAGSGIGNACVRALSCPTLHNIVYAVDICSAALDLLVSECGGSNVVIPLCCDLSDWDATRSLLQRTLPPLVHGLVNNAGVGAEGGLLDSNVGDALDRIIAVNTRAVVNVSQVVAQRLIEYNQLNGTHHIASIVNVSSLASRFPTRISLGYNLSKAALDMLTKGMALELGPHNVRVNSVNPNIVLGTQLTNAWVGASGDALKEKLLARTPLKRCLSVGDVVNAILFLLWDKGVTMVHGESLFVDGGYSVA